MKRTPLRRKSRLKPRRERERRVARKSKPKRPEGYENPAYLAFVRKLGCCGPKQALVFEGCIGRWKYWPCEGKVHAHHAGHSGHGRGAGMKPPDDTAIPLCTAHHTGKHGWHNSNGFAKGWTPEQRRSWADTKIAETQALWRAGRPPEPCGCPF